MPMVSLDGHSPFRIKFSQTNYGTRMSQLHGFSRIEGLFDKIVSFCKVSGKKLRAESGLIFLAKCDKTGDKTKD